MKVKGNKPGMKSFLTNEERLIQDNIDNLVELTELLSVEPFDLAAAEEFGKIQGELKQIGRPTGEVDALSEAVARSRQDILVINNIRDFENIANLQLENWLES
jgi:tRNA(fMet)-specific endonuclease VapC